MAFAMSEPCRLYVISPPVIADAARFVDLFRSAMSGGDIACFQLRMKSPEGVAAPDADILRVAEAILPVARAAGVHFLINDRPDLARRVGADGVHVGQQDAGYAEARRILGGDATIGVTCHNSCDLAMRAGEAGADYVAFGAFFPTRTKEASTRADPSLLENWSMATTVPCVAIGGITAENCAPLVRAGADFVAVSGAVWNDADGPAKSVARLTAAICAARG